MNPLFGPAGNADSFKSQGYKTTLDAPGYLVKMGLDAYEYQGGRGITISEEKARMLGEKARELSIRLSIHAPYYISMSSVEEEKRLGSIKYIIQSARAARAMGANRIIVHSGSCGKITREYALELAKSTMTLALDEMDRQGYSDIHICPETMGKINQLGSLFEVIELCKLDERLIPCIDFGHLNARTNGSLKTREDFLKIFDTIENELGSFRLQNFHSHFSKIEYTEKGGEKCHLTFSDEIYGPSFEPVAEIVARKGLSPIFICESSGTQAEDAFAMKTMFLSAKEGMDDQ